MTLMLVVVSLYRLMGMPRPALTKTEIRSVSPSGEVAVASANAVGGSSISVTPTAPPTLRRWSRPTATPMPIQDATGEAAPAEVQELERRGPQSLTLWDRTEVEVMPAQRKWVDGVYRWTIPDWLAGWHSDSDDCGDGLTLIGGHVSYSGRAGIFGDLPTVGEDDLVTCTDWEGKFHRYQPVDYLMVTAETKSQQWAGDGIDLILYTCTPELDGMIVIRYTEVEE